MELANKNLPYKQPNPTLWWRTRWLPRQRRDNLTWAFSHFPRSGGCWQSQRTCRWTWRTRRLLPCCLHVGKMWSSKNIAVSAGLTLTLADRWRCVRTKSVGDARLYAVRKNVRDPVFMLGFCQNYNPNVPQCVNRHLEVKNGIIQVYNN